MKRNAFIIFTIIAPLFAVNGISRAADLVVTPTDAAMPTLVQVLAPPYPKSLAVSENAPFIAVAQRMEKDKPGTVAIFGLDAQGNCVGTPAPAARAAAGAPTTPPALPTPLFTLTLPKLASLAANTNFATSVAFHPKLPLLFVWQEIDGPPFNVAPYLAAKDNPVFKEFDHLLIYSLAPGVAPKLELATARGPGFMYGNIPSMLVFDPAGKRLMMPNMRSLNSADNAAGGVIGFLKLDDHGMPVKDGEKLAITGDEMGTYGYVPEALGCAWIGESAAVVGGPMGPITWIIKGGGNRRGIFNGYFPGSAPCSTRLAGHWSLPQVYLTQIPADTIFRMEHVDGYLTMQPQKLTIAGASGFQSAPVMMSKQNKIAIGASLHIYLVSLDAAGNLAAPVTQVAANNGAIAALAYSERFDRLYVTVEK